MDGKSVSLNDIAYLTVITPQEGVSQFTPDEEIKIVLSCTPGYVGTGVLHIGLYPYEDDPSTEYTIPNAQKPISMSIGGGLITVTWTIPANTLMPPAPSFLVQQIYAWVYIYTNEGPEHSETPLIPQPNPILLDMFVVGNSYYKFIKVGTFPMEEAHEYHATNSTCTVEIRYRYNSMNIDNSDSSNKLNTYQFILYKSDKKTVKFDTDQLKTWDTNSQETATYTFRDLEDNSTYYVRSIITLDGGYTLSCPSNGEYLPIYVHYSDRPTLSEHLKLTNTPSGVECELDTTVPYTSYSISRTRYNESEYIDIGTAIDPATKIVDSYAIPKEDYIYKVIVYNGELIVATYYNEIVYESNYVKISDALGCYTAVGDVTKHPISRNDRGQILEAMDSIFPYNIVNGAPNYDMGSVDGIFSDLDDDCKFVVDSDYLAAKADILRRWLNNGRAKLLTYYTGEAWIVSVKGVQTTDPENNDVYHTVFQWTQIGDASLIPDYVRLGLIISDG